MVLHFLSYHDSPLIRLFIWVFDGKISPTSSCFWFFVYFTCFLIYFLGSVFMSCAALFTVFLVFNIVFCLWVPLGAGFLSE